MMMMMMLMMMMRRSLNNTYWFGGLSNCHWFGGFGEDVQISSCFRKGTSSEPFGSICGFKLLIFQCVPNFQWLCLFQRFFLSWSNKVDSWLVKRAGFGGSHDLKVLPIPSSTASKHRKIHENQCTTIASWDEIHRVQFCIMWFLQLRSSFLGGHPHSLEVTHIPWRSPTSTTTNQPENQGKQGGFFPTFTRSIPLKRSP